MSKCEQLNSKISDIALSGSMKNALRLPPSPRGSEGADSAWILKNAADSCRFPCDSFTRIGADLEFPVD